MTLTLNQVQMTRFRLARRNGYEPVDVDNFVDEVEKTLIELGEEKEALTKQVEALKASGGSADAIYIDAPASSDEANGLRAEIENLNIVAGQAQSEAAELRNLNESLRSDNENLRNEINGLREVMSQSEGENSAAAEQIAAAHQQAAEQVANVRAEADQRVAAVQAEAEQRFAAIQAEYEQQLAEARAVAEQAEQRIAEAHAAGEERVAAVQADYEQRLAAVPTETPAETTSELPPADQLKGNFTVTTAAEAAPFVGRMLEAATNEAAAIVAEADEQARNVLAEAERVSHEKVADAEYRADRIEAEARHNASQVLAEAQARADALDGQTTNRRQELFTTMEEERDLLASRVDHLRNWESQYRDAIINHLKQQIDAVSSSKFQGDETPHLIGENRGESATPRLDALLNGDQE